MVSTKREIRTEKDRYGGFLTKPSRRSYFAESARQTLVDTEEIIQRPRDFREILPLHNLVSDNEESDLFEIEKEYSNFTPVRAEEEPVRRLPDFKVTSVSSPVAKAIPAFGVRAKIWICVLAAIVSLLVGFAVYNSVQISAKRLEVSSIQSQITARQHELNLLNENFEILASQQKILETLSNGNSLLRLPQENDFQEIQLGKSEVRPNMQTPTNWFDKICKFFSSLF